MEVPRAIARARYRLARILLQLFKDRVVPLVVKRRRAAAQTRRADAADKRTTADRVEDLANAEKQSRRNAAR
ncbi:hypothetical protein [Arthrobacter sp. SLBN-53]|uniref:hypothetical protein n=1 Tax=Arthrobacter sp. SLBN-53 TaxID=2768412 RepID=UPI001153DA53|nr:hypothetical protein [Arthrobacter sp. SLBN-53]